MQILRIRPSNEARASRGAWGAAVLLTPHLVLGTWLLVVPDYLAFLTSQVVTLLHVSLAALSLPLVAVWVFQHAGRREPLRERRQVRAAIARWLLAATTILAALTGASVTWGGSIARTHALHAASGLAVGVQLAWHLWAARRRRAAGGVAALLLVAAGGAAVTRRLLPPRPLDAAVPAFEYRTRPAALYESAAACGECHTENYADWKRSTHARTMQNPLIREGFAHHKDTVGFDLADFQRIMQGAAVAHAGEAFNTCEMCHAPTSFYGDDRESPLQATGTPAEGVTCSFCHTLRAVNPGDRRGQPVPKELAVPSRGAEFLPLLPKYVSAPETVRRYLGQGSPNWLLHSLSNALIRWRPDVHRRDYHAPVLDSALACMPCHSLGGLDMRPELPQKTYRSWETSRYSTGDPETTVTCQDCHMARRVTGRRPHEPGPLVPWGPDRERHRSHLFLGGNRVVPELLHDPDFELLEHQINAQSATVALVAARRDGDRFEVDVRVETRLVGHDLPSMGAQNRWLWVEVTARDAAGRALGASKPPRGGDDVGGESPVMFRCIDRPAPTCDTALQAGVAQVVTARFSVRPQAVATLEAVLHISVDRDAIATDARPYPL